jgi:rRNA maturation RNase YbeY
VASTVRWPVARALARRTAAHASLALAFVGPARMRSLNRAWFGKDRPTDVIAFSYDGPAEPERERSEREVGARSRSDLGHGRTDGRTRTRSSVRRSVGPSPLGEVFICPAIAARNARRFGAPPREETLRLIVHGVLHVLGYDHPEGAGRMASPMWRRQERYLAAVLRRA